MFPVSQHPGHKCMPPDSALMWVLGIQIKVLMTAQQTLYQFSHHSPRHLCTSPLRESIGYLLYHCSRFPGFALSLNYPLPHIVSGSLSIGPQLFYQYIGTVTSLLSILYWWCCWINFLVAILRKPHKTNKTHTCINNNYPYSFLNKI